MSAPDETGRIDPVIELLTRLASGEFDARGERCDTDEDIDAVIVGINMLAEELDLHRTELEQRVRERTLELEEARREALESARVKSEFLATMSHEIRTPMNGVIGLTSLLLETELDNTQRQYAEGVQLSGTALLDVINDILDFSKLEAGMVDLEVEELDPRELVEEVAALLALTASHKGLELIAYCRPEVPVRLLGDPARLRQVLLNLTSNAVKFTDVGEVVLTARPAGNIEGSDESSDSAGPSRVIVRFQVTDTGIGISPQAQRSLFESFTQADASTTRRFGGTGLGLAISRRLAQAMGGEIGVDSEEGVGSTFWFEVPLGVALPRPQAAERPPPNVLAGVRALIVDDNRTNRQVLDAQLTTWGMRPDTIELPATAVAAMSAAAAAGDPYGLAVLDMCMPDMDGLDLARAIAAEPELKATPLILLTSSMEVDKGELRRAGVRDWLHKPVRSSELFDRVMRLVSPAVPPASQGGSYRPLSVAPGSLGRVLVVEDNALNQLVAEGVVARLGYQVDLVGNGAEALAALDVNRYDAVLMDVHMPVMDGFTATERIRAQEAAAGTRRMPVIAMTAGATTEDRERCMAAGMDDFVSKPVDVAAVGAALASWAGTPQRDAEPPAPTEDRPVLDPDQLAALRSIGPDDGLGLLPAVAESFLEQAPQLLARLRRASTEGDREELRDVAHQLKGAAANAGAVRVSNVCEQIDGAATGPSAGVLRLMESLTTQLDHASRALVELLQS